MTHGKIYEPTGCIKYKGAFDYTFRKTELELPNIQQEAPKWDVKMQPC